MVRFTRIKKKKSKQWEERWKQKPQWDLKNQRSFPRGIGKGGVDQAEDVDKSGKLTASRIL